MSRVDDLYETMCQALVAGENILFHCVAGRHRSVAIVVACLVKLLRKPPFDVMSHVVGQRRCAVNHTTSEFYQGLVKWSHKQMATADKNS
jgi:protein-tyrosine phosphatase